MEKEDKRCEHKASFDEWERVQAQLRLLREDLKTCTDDDIKAELHDDIAGLRRRKNELALKLGFK